MMPWPGHALAVGNVLNDPGACSMSTLLEGVEHLDYQSGRAHCYSWKTYVEGSHQTLNERWTICGTLKDR